MKKLFIRMSILLLVMITIILPSSCTLPWVHEDDEYDITSKFKAVWNVHERFETNSDGSITYNSVRFGGLIGLVKEHNLPVDWTKYESVTFEFADTTTVETQIMLGTVMRTYGRPGIKKLTCYFDGLDMRQVDQVVLQTSLPSTLVVKKVTLSPATTSWDSKPIWEGECKFGNWENGFVIKPEFFATAYEGDKIEFIFNADTSNPDITYWLLKTVYNTTPNTLEGNDSELNDYGCASVSSHATAYRILLTANDVENLQHYGLFTNGFSVYVKQVNLLRRVYSEE